MSRYAYLAHSAGDSVGDENKRRKGFGVNQSVCRSGARQRMMRHPSKTFILLVFVVTVTAAQAAPDGWRMAHSGGEQSWSKTFSQGKMRVYASAWKNPGTRSVKGWLREHKMDTRKGDRVTSKKVAINKSRQGESYYVVRSLNSRGQEKRISVLTACGANSRVRLVEAVAPQSLFSRQARKAVVELALVIQEACRQMPVTINKAHSHSSGTDVIPTRNESPGKRAGASSLLKPAKPPKGLKELRGVVTYGIQPGGMFGPTSDVVALFGDGTYSSDLQRLFARGIAASKAAKPGRWGRWRKRGGTLEFKEEGEGKYETTYGDWIARHGGKNLKLSGCFGSINSASSSPYGGGTTVGNASSWCFRSDGRFSHSSTGFASASGGVRGASASSRKTGGRYRIDGYTARFVYDDDKEIVTAFCFLNDKKSHIAINGKRYMGGK